MKSLTKNLALRIVALILGFLFWFNVVTNKTYDYSLDVAFRMEAIPEELILTTPPANRINVKMEGTGKQLLTFIYKKPTLIYNAANFERGIYRVDLAPADLRFDDEIRARVAAVNDPQSLTLKFEGLEKKIFPISSEITITPALGYALAGGLKLTPDSVEVNGPRRIIRALDSIPTEKIHFEDVKKDVDEQIRLAVHDTLFLTLALDHVQIGQKIVPLTERKIGPLAVKLLNTKLYKSVQIEPDSIYVILEGPQDFLEALIPAAITVSLNLQEIEPGTSSILPKIFVPEGYRLVGTEPSSLSVTALKP